MVYYIDDVVNKGWSVVVPLKPRDLYEMGEIVEEVYENEPYQDQELEKFYSNDNEYLQLAINHLDGDIPNSNVWVEKIISNKFFHKSNDFLYSKLFSMHVYLTHVWFLNVIFLRWLYVASSYQFQVRKDIYINL